ncbi:Tricorn protease-interacting factor F3 [Seminavis robusta]|uniref:Aminopeptidase n=1 Tax=Seminavis robusta TaxID=568900 RepID=A0A9N8HR20_9STRA|nr:Tricorn protease-interacting factor F3 [Seminavis robusta]|eukprot:Sro1219_g253390.1 Tricorn protease-interacting factor F3 (917) ;mRNA; f:1857-5044
MMSTSSTTSSNSRPTMTVVNGRLPQIATPSHYDLTFTQVDLEGFTFSGTVVMSLTRSSTAEAVDHSSLVVHARELQLLSSTLTRKSDDSSFQAVEFRYQLHHETCEIVFDSSPWTTTSGPSNTDTECTLTMEFCGILNDQMAGFYRSQYTDLQGRCITMASTQFEPTDARRAFPCWDEPALKATFQMTVILPNHQLQAISNTPIISSHTTMSTSNQTLIKTVRFDKTPKMSTYLVALVIGQFDSISTTSPQSQIQTTVYTRPGKAAQGQFCLDTASQCLDFLQDTYGVPYPLGKSDLIGIADFAAGAMENWGCVTYREAKILVTAGTSTTMKRGIARTVCHELAHQWFGNLVTPEFWTQLWLKEGVARFMEFVALEHLFPEWKPWEEFVQSVYNLALSLDSLESSHPVEVVVTHSDEINEIFDAISYAKGASIIRMLCHYIGKQTFMDGMRLYLQRHAYGNTTSEDFWAALAEVSGKPCVKFMEPWTKLMGFPLLQLIQDDNNSKITMTTNQFRSSNTAASSTENTTTKEWPMPVTARVEGSDKVFGPWVLHGPDHDDSEAFLKQLEEWSAGNKWFKLNVDQHAFFRVNYTPQQWSRLANAMTSLSVTDQLGLVGDSFAAGKFGYASIVDSLKLVEGFGEHDTAEYVVWQELAGNLSTLASLYRSEPYYPQFQDYVKKLFAKQAGILGWESSPDESARTGTLRGSVLRMMGIANDAETKAEGYKRFMELTRMPSLEGAVSGDIQRVLFHLALKHDEATVFPALKRVVEEHAGLSPETQRDCLVVMGSVHDAKFHNEMLEYVFFSGKVRHQDVAFPLSALSGGSDQGGRATWNFFVQNYHKLRLMLGAGFLWRDVVGVSARGLRTLKEAQEAEDFFKDPKHPVGSGARRLQQALEVVRNQAGRIERDREALTKFFQA